MHQLLSQKIKIWIIVTLAAVVAAAGRLADLGTLSLGVIVGVVDFLVIQLMMHSWAFCSHFSWMPRPAWARTNLSGMWQGEIRSQWKKNPDDPPLPPIPAKLDLRQSWRDVLFNLETAKMHSRSSPAVPTFDASSNSLQFRYFFSTEPTAATSTENPPQHLGSAVAQINLDQPDRMIIKYTNERSPGGDIVLERVKSPRAGRSTGKAR